MAIGIPRLLSLTTGISIGILARRGNWFSSAKKAGLEIPTGCLTGSCGACEIDVNGSTVRACISEIKNNKKCTLQVSLTTDPFWEK